MAEVEIKYFALLKDESGKDSEKYTTDGLTYRDLFLELQNKYEFSVKDTEIRVAVNDAFDSLDSQIIDQAKIVFIPPVSGG